MIASQTRLPIMRAEHMLEKTGSDKVLETHCRRHSIQIVIADWLQLPARGWGLSGARSGDSSAIVKPSSSIISLNWSKMCILLLCQARQRLPTSAIVFAFCVEVIDAMHKPSQSRHVICVTRQRHVVDRCIRTNLYPSSLAPEAPVHTGSA